MRIYKNLLFAYSFEIIFGLTTTLLVIFLVSYAIAFLAFFAVRPIILKTKEISAQDDYWFISYQLIRYSLFIISFIIIVLYVIYYFFLDKEFLFAYRDKIIVFFPLLLFIHGILGLFSLRRT